MFYVARWLLTFHCRIGHSHSRLFWSSLHLKALVAAASQRKYFGGKQQPEPFAVTEKSVTGSANRVAVGAGNLYGTGSACQ